MQDGSNTYGHQLSPDFLSNYEITGLLGEGGMGQVLRGRQKGLGRDVAIKLLTNRSYATPERRQRFKDEAQRCAAMSHPNLVGVYDYGEEGERPYMVMELVDGESLADRIKRDGRVPIKEALQISVEICAGLAYAHELGLIHRDIKSDNILLDRNEKTVKVADFGIATESGDTKEKENVIIGTPSYMSPEQASGKKADARSDLYSTGVILYEMLTGRVPFTGETSMAIIIKHLNEQAASMRELNPDVPPQLEELVLRSLEKDPNRRFQNAQAFSSQLKKASSLLESWQQLAREQKAGARSTTSSIAVPISSIMPESEEERFKKRVAYSLAGVLGFCMLAVVFYFTVLAPPTYEASERRVEPGFTEAALAYRTNHPATTWVQYQETSDGAIREVRTDTEAAEHQVMLEGLKEDTLYRWRPMFPHEQEGSWGDFQTLTLDFTGVEMSPRVNGARIQWRTSLPVEMEVEYLQEGKVKEIIKLQGIRTEHQLNASFPDPSVPYQVRLEAIKDGRFSASHLIEEVPIIDLGEIEELNRSIQRVLHSDQPALYTMDVFSRFEELDVSGQLERFQRIRDLFFTDPQVTAELRMELVQQLSRLHELDLFVAWAGDAIDLDGFDTGAAEALAPGYLATQQAPFSRGRSVDVLSRQKDMVFDFAPPDPPITGDRPPDATDNAKFEIPEGALRDAEEAFFEIQVEDVAANCFFEVEFGHGKNPSARVSFYPPRSKVRSLRPYSGTFYVRFDPRLVNPRKKLKGWVKLLFLRGTVADAEAARSVHGGFRGLRLVGKR